MTTYRKIDDYLKLNHLKLKSISITSLSKLMDVSVSAITRYCKRKGYNGYKDFELVLYEFNSEKNKFNRIISSLEKTNQLLNFGDIKWVAKNIWKSNKVIILGESFTFLQGKILEHKLLRININAKAINIASDLSIVLPEDKTMYIFISHSGMNKNIKRAATKIKSSNAGKMIFVSITSKKNNIIKDLCNINLSGHTFTNKEITEVELPSTSLLVSQMIIDYVFRETIKINLDSNKELIYSIKSDKE